MITENDFTRINNDTYGNPRHVFHFLHLLTEKERETINLSNQYRIAIKRANKIGGRKFHNKQYGGGIVITTYSIPEDISKINTLIKRIEQNENNN